MGLPGAPWYCTPNCVHCSASKGYDFLDQECPKDIEMHSVSSRRLSETFPQATGHGNFTNQSVQLYDLVKDPSETTDLAASRPDIVKELGARLDKWEAETYLGPGEDPAFTPGCAKQKPFPNHDGPKHVPLLYPYCDLSLTLVV